MATNLTGNREYFGRKDPHVVTCQLCGDSIYREKVVFVGEGVQEDESGSKRAVDETPVCPECALYISMEKDKERLQKLDILVRAVTNAEAAGLPMWEIDAIAQKWEKRMESLSLEQFRAEVARDRRMMDRFEGRA